jgi:phage terminase large subunit-like protein
MAKLYGRETPRLWTRPLRPLTPETSLGFEVIEFALVVLGVDLYPWQKWLLIHALELREDGTYRFRRVIVLVGRQNGKTTLASVLAAWWLYVDSARNPDRIPPFKFKVVGVAQNLDIAKEPWSAVKLWCDPDPETAEEAELGIEALVQATAKVRDANGSIAITARSRAHYEIRAAKNARGKPAAKVLMDEMREQRDWSAWNAVSQTTKSFWNGMLVGFSNAGDAGSLVLWHQRNAALLDLIAAGIHVPDYVEDGIADAEAYANGETVEAVPADESLGIFEWSAAPGCAKNDVDAILQSNPSIGHGSMTIEICLADIRGMTDAGYRTEVLCQWVTSRVEPYLDPTDWEKAADPVLLDEQGALLDPGSTIAADSRMVLGIDVFREKRLTRTSMVVAGYRDDGRIHLEVIAQRTGMTWVVKHAKRVRAKTGITQVALQTKGCDAADLVTLLVDAGFTIVDISATTLLLAAGRLTDRLREDKIRHRSQGPLNLAVANGATRALNGMPVWDRDATPVDVAPVIAATYALVGLESFAPPPKKKPAPPPPPARVLTRGEVETTAQADVLTAAF